MIARPAPDPEELAELERKVASVVNDPAYEAGLRAEQEAKAREIRRQLAARLRRLATVAIAALRGEHGPVSQAMVESALKAFGDVRPEVEALARWDFEHRRGEPPMSLDLPLLRRALEDRRVENSLRACEALARDLDREKKKDRKAGTHG